MTMAHLRSIGSLLSGYSSQGSSHNNLSNNEDIVKTGYLAKRKNMKNRFYVLRRETSEELPARLECYDSEKKFLDGCQPKKKYILKECFNISKKTDKNNYVIALYLNKDCIALVTKNEADMQEWLSKLKQHKCSGADYIEAPKIEYEHVWQVEVLDRSLASIQNLTGQHFLCLTNRLLSLVRVEDPHSKKEFHLSTIKKCGFVDQFFNFELGRNSCIGCGEIYVQTEDAYIAQNIHNSVNSAMKNIRLSSTSESEIRSRTTSDPHPDGYSNRSRDRSDSVPNNNVKNIHTKLGICQSLDQTNIHKVADGAQACSLKKEAGSHLSLEKDFSETDGDFTSNYLPMSTSTSESIQLLISSQRVTTHSDAEEEEYTYMEMNSGLERNPPNSLGVCPFVNPGTSSPGNSSSHIVSTASVSPSPGGGIALWGSGHSPSPAGYHSRNPSLPDDGYVPMSSPGSQGPQIVQGPQNAVSNYLDMSLIPSLGEEGCRTISTPTPIPLSPSDEDYEMFGQSGSSSCTSGTPSDQRIHEIGEDDLGLHQPIWGSLTPNYSGSEDTDSFGGPRSIRTSSVGSKPEQFKRKNRLDTATQLSEPARARAFSVGSRVSLKFGMGRHGPPQHGTEQAPGGLGELFPSIKECGKQAKNKSSSAPMLGGSPVSHSWSGTPGSYFRGLIMGRSAPKEANLMMELDFTKNKSYDYIAPEEKDRRTSKERLWHTLTGCRHRPNPKCSSGKEKRMSEGDDASSRGVEIPKVSGDRSDYLQLDFTRSPRNFTSDTAQGYLPMYPPAFLSSSLTARGGDMFVEKRGPRSTSLNEPYLEMSSSLSSCASQDGYVDMTQGSTSPGLTLASSSSSSNSIGGPVPTRTRRSTALTAPVFSSQDLPSPLEDLGFDEELENLVTVESKKKKKVSKRRSLRDGVKRKKSDTGSGVSGSASGGQDSPEVAHKQKSTGPLATLTSLITRKPTGNTSPNQRVPLSPKTSPLPPKGSSPFSSLKRIKKKDKEERESVSLSGDIYDPPAASALSPQGSFKRASEGAEFATSKRDDKIMIGPIRHASLSDASKRLSTFEKLQEANGGSLSSLDRLHSSPRSPQPVDSPHSYVNMQPGASSPQQSPTGGTASSPRLSSPRNHRLPLVASPPIKASPVHDDNYMMMGGEPAGDPAKEARAPSFPSAVAKRPEIPPTLLSSHSHSSAQPLSSALGLEKLSVREEKPGSERSRSHSGPGAPGAQGEGPKPSKDSGEDGRASSACSSPASYSPPTSPTLGSVSSMSSLSEGGLSSASSTNTVVNVGLKNRGDLKANLTLSPATNPGPTLIVASSGHLPPTTLSGPLPPSAPSVGSVNSSPSGLSPTAAPSWSPPPTALSEPLLPDKSGNKACLVPVSSSATPALTSDDDQSLNYIALDLGSGNKKAASPQLTTKSGNANTTSDEGTSSSYVEIDFKKSEGLRNTSIARETQRPH